MIFRVTHQLEDRVATPFDAAITAIEEEMRLLQASLKLLRRKQAEHAGEGLQLALGTSAEAPSTNGTHRPGMTVEESVDRVLGAQGNGWISTSDIVKQGGRLTGKEPNINSVRWTIKHGVDDNRYEKRKEGGRLYHYPAVGRVDEEYEAFRRRDLSALDYVYVWVDGIHLNIRLEDDRLCLLVMIGASRRFATSTTRWDRNRGSRTHARFSVW